MQITSKGQVTIPQDVRNRLGLLPHTEVEFELAEDCALIRKSSRATRPSDRGTRILEALRGTADTRMSTDEIMALTRASTRASVRELTRAAGAPMERSSIRRKKTK
jgi:AbrB family looped-hinge helix DNA binding protein